MFDIEIKSWKVTYKHVVTGEIIHAVVHARTIQDARRQARENANECCEWELYSVEVME